MTIGIMGAMPEEVNILREQMSDITEVTMGSRQFCCGKLNQQDVVLVFSRWGKVAAATTATTLITHFNITQLIFTGVAGAVSPSLNIGDIVIARELYQHDMDPSPLFPKHEIPLTGNTFFEANTALVNNAQAAAEQLLATIDAKIPLQTLSSFQIKAPRCHIGTIASGDQFVASTQQTNAILHDQPTTLAVEMEGAAVAQVCYDYQIPFVVIRTISDRADHEAHIDFPSFIADVASHYTEAIVPVICVDASQVVA